MNCPKVHPKCKIDLVVLREKVQALVVGRLLGAYELARLDAHMSELMGSGPTLPPPREPIASKLGVVDSGAGATVSASATTDGAAGHCEAPESKL